MQTAPESLFFSAKGIIGPQQFDADLDRARHTLASASVVCNLHQDRYQFSLGIVAALLNKQPTILPPSLAPEAILSAVADAPGSIILTENPKLGSLGNACDVQTGAIHVPLQAEGIADVQNNPTAIRVFSSGSTSKPQCNIKTWDMLCSGAAVTHRILQDLNIDPADLALIGTTPHGHMFGLEAMVFATLGFGYSSYRDTVFYPADLELAIQAARDCGFSKLVLVTSPAHLRFLEPVILAAPEIICILSATAPFPKATAERLMVRSDLKIMEIYGSTETGSMAFRHTPYEQAWMLFDGFKLTKGVENYLVSAPHLPTIVPIGDEVELHSDGRFTLLGRVGDMINVRGKRNKVSALNSLLVEIPDISDGVYLHVKNHETDQLALAIVPSSDNPLPKTELIKRVRQHLLRHLDAAFVPKKVLVLDQIPRSATGKITHKTLVDLSQSAGLSD